MAVSVEVDLDIDRTDHDIRIFMQSAVERDINRRTKNVTVKVRELIRERADVNTPGGLADSVYGQVYIDGPQDFSSVVASDSEYALAFEEGTGLYGPRSAYIFPRGPGPMVFHHRQLNRVVWAFRVEGQPGKHPFRDAIEAAAP